MVSSAADFDQNDWDHLHDVIVSATGKTTTQPELEAFFAGLPAEWQNNAYRWGMADTV